jgi:chaperonin GroEL
VAVVTGGRAFLQEVMRPLSEIKLVDLGRAKKVIVTKGATTLIGGFGSQKEIAARIKQLKTEMSQTRSDFEIERLRERLAKLGGGIAVLKSSGRTADDLEDSRYKIESAMHCCSSAIENGYVVGGGVCYCRAISFVDKLVPKNPTEKLGIEAVSHALTAPLRQLLQNSQHGSPEDVIKQVIESRDEATGFNVESGRVEDLLSARIFDSAKALHYALASSFTYAEGILKTAAWDTAPSPDGKDHTQPDF